MTDGETDRRTDRMLIANAAVHYFAQSCEAHVKRK